MTVPMKLHLPAWLVFSTLTILSAIYRALHFLPLIFRPSLRPADISEMVSDGEENLLSSNRISNGVFTFDVGPLRRSRSRSCIFLLRISLKVDVVLCRFISFYTAVSCCWHATASRQKVIATEL